MILTHGPDIARCFASLGAMTVWRGIPYAQAPVGPLRFRAPQPIKTRPRLDGATESVFGPVCPQPISPLVPLPPGATMDEDCLTLNIWTADADSARPVLVWVHGGAYVEGFGSGPSFDGTRLAAEGAVVVTLNYRLGALGWLDLPGVTDTNVGLRDVMTALRWVRENIAAYGGDAHNVTVFGESAGAGIVTTLLATPTAAGLFDAAISESSPATTVATRAQAADVAARLLARLGVSPEGLTDVDSETLVAASTAVFRDVPSAAPGRLAWCPVVGDDLVPEDPAVVLARGDGHPVPLLIGTNHDEARAFAHSHSPLLPVSAEGLHALFAEVQEAHPGSAVPLVPAARRALLDEATDASFRMPAIWIAEGHSAVAPTFLYRFDHATPALRLLGIDAAHATEIPYVFGTYGINPKDPTLKLGGRHDVERISDRVRRRWVEFAATRRPDAGSAAPWPAYDTTTRASLLIDVHDRVVLDVDGERRSRWGDVVLDLA